MFSGDISPLLTCLFFKLGVIICQHWWWKVCVYWILINQMWYGRSKRDWFTTKQVFHQVFILIHSCCNNNRCCCTIFSFILLHQELCGGCILFPNRLGNERWVYNNQVKHAMVFLFDVYWIIVVIELILGASLPRFVKLRWCSVSCMKKRIEGQLYVRVTS